MGVSQSLRRGNALLYIGLIAFLLLVGWGWVGFLGSDDVTYAIGAYGWIEQFPFVGGHGTIRYPITIPMALSFVTFGQNEVAMVLPSLLYMLGFLACAWFAVRRVSDVRQATAALAALACCPLLVVQSSIASVDIVEMAFLFASVFLFHRCIDDGPSVARLLGAGICAGLAFITRETAIFVALFYAGFFLFGYRFHRGHYLWIAAGFLLVWALEVLYLFIMTGDPLYRINISMHHDSTIDRSIDLAGNLIVHPLIDPLLVLLLNQEFMALFFLAIPLGAWLCFGRNIEPRLQRFARVIAWFGIVWFVAAGAAQKLLPLNPRYFMITAAAVCILTGIGLLRLYDQRRTRLVALALAALLIGTNLLGIYVENKDSMFGERTLARIAAEQGGAKIYTDPMTRYRADMLLRWEGARNRVLPQPAPAGALYFYNPNRADTANFKMSGDQIAAFQPQPGWRKIGEWEPEPPMVTRLLETTGVSALIPQGIWKKLRYRHPKAFLYRT